ncbi:hypothetical protein [Egicoccus halophilus]|uniref:Uncharacterized protein n=1 Tax=Egicoccus halophilus TaxID=1670830 RepID=A0A8J3ACJ1_9ACTN|nr:hypothetical protein [Egicoccus halophilus]GGI08717.1 hypothetical protein GCM10011354_30490 [Egicoccus halophilus]
MTRTDDLPPFETRLLTHLLEVVEDRAEAATEETPPADPANASRGGGLPRFAVAAGVAALAVGLAVGPGLSRDGGSPAFAVRELDGGVIEVRYDTDFRDGHALEAALREHGVDVRILPVPATPSAVGEVHGLEMGEPGATTPGFTWGPDGGDFAFTIDPAVFREELTLHLAVEAAPGEPYQLAEEAFEPGEVLGGLHCHLGEPVQASALVPYLDALDLDVVWEVIGPSPDGEPSSAFTERVDTVPDGRVMSGYAVDATTVRFEVELPTATLDPAHWQPRLSDEPCTPELAAAWE